jgi:cellulose synthase/poly-beta-1,6-N-acetylglucosamine synthase-like glycosyltransferase
MATVSYPEVRIIWHIAWQCPLGRKVAVLALGAHGSWTSSRRVVTERMVMFPFILSVVSFLLCCGVAVDILRGFRRLTRLEHVAPGTGDLPRVSIIFGARDEQEATASAARSHIAQDYPDFEVIAVDDRSSDRTPQLLAQLARETARLHVLRVEALPPGWLGKYHALR